MANMLLVPVRTSRQGVTLNVGKLKPDYQDETSTVEMHAEDMARLGLQKGDHVRLRAANGNAILVKCKVQKGEGASPGLMFIAYGPNSSVLMEADTAGTGMPLSKHLAVEVEGPLGPDGERVAPGMGATLPHSFGVAPSGPLNSAQANALNGLLASALNPVQAAWLSGYFAALSGGQALAVGGSAGPDMPGPRIRRPTRTCTFLPSGRWKQRRAWMRRSRQARIRACWAGFRWR